MKKIQMNKSTMMILACAISSGRGLSCTEQMGGAKTLFLANYDPLVAYQFGATTPKTIDATPTLTAYRFDLEAGNGGFTENITKDQNTGARYYEQTGDFTLIGLSPEDQAQLDELTAGRFWLWVEDQNGKVILYGQENGCWVTAGSGSTGVGAGDLSGYILTFLGRERLSASFNQAYTNFPFDTLPDITVDPAYPVVI